MKVREFSFIILILCLFCSCNEDVEHKRVLMEDGNVIYLENEDVAHYNTEQDLAAVYNNYVYSRNSQSDDSVDYSIRTDSVFGYTSVDVDARWSIATFGDWIADYGLTPGEKYYVQSVVEVCKQLPCYSGEQVVASPYNGEMSHLMGYTTSGKRGYGVGPIRDTDGYYIGVTLVTNIAYDENGKSVQCYYPVKDLTTLKWKFKALAIDWK